MIIEICGISSQALEFKQGENHDVISEAAFAGRKRKRLLRFEQGYFSQQTLQ